MTNENLETLLDLAESLEQTGQIDGLVDELRYLWDHPDEFEDGTALENSEIDRDDLRALVHLCVSFGSEYERAYPTDEDHWRSDV